MAQVQFTYACTVTAGATVPGSVTFKTTPTAGVGTGGFVEATSNSVLVTPPLTFQVTVNESGHGDPDQEHCPDQRSRRHDSADRQQRDPDRRARRVDRRLCLVGRSTLTGRRTPASCPSLTIPSCCSTATSTATASWTRSAVTSRSGGPAFTSGGFYLFDNLPPGNYLVDVYEDSITTERRTAQHRADHGGCAVREPGAGRRTTSTPTSATSRAPRSRATSSGTRTTTASSIPASRLTAPAEQRRR